MRAKSASFEITPKVQIDMGAGARGPQVSVGVKVEEPLEINLLILWGDDEEPILLVSLDLLYPGDFIRSTVEAAASGLSPERIFVAASHTHQAPMTDGTKPELGRPDKAFMTDLAQKMSEVVRELLVVDDAIDVTLAAGSAQGDHSINRRKKAFFSLGNKRLLRNRVIFAPNHQGIVDETITLLAVLNAQGQPLAWVWNYACHPVAHPRKQTYSSHYAHWVRKKLRSGKSIPGVPVLFFQGFSGNTRPKASIGVKGFWGVISRIVSGPQFRDMTEVAYQLWVDSLANLVESVALVSLENEVSLQAVRLIRPGNDFAIGLKTSVSFQKISLCPEFSIVGVSGEVVAEYGDFVRGLTQSHYTMTVGCIDSTFGYIPTNQMILEGGYEGGEFCAPFGLKSITPTIEATTKRCFRMLQNL